MKATANFPAFVCPSCNSKRVSWSTKDAKLSCKDCGFESRDPSIERFLCSECRVKAVEYYLTADALGCRNCGNVKL